MKSCERIYLFVRPVESAAPFQAVLIEHGARGRKSGYDVRQIRISSDALVVIAGVHRNRDSTFLYIRGLWK